MARLSRLRELPAMNSNYDPPQPWRCISHERHECDGQVIGQVGVPVCAAAAELEQARQDEDAARWAAWGDSPAGRAEAAAEQAWEARVS